MIVVARTCDDDISHTYGQITDNVKRINDQLKNDTFSEGCMGKMPGGQKGCKCTTDLCNKCTIDQIRYDNCTRTSESSKAEPNHAFFMTSCSLTLLTAFMKSLIIYY